MNDLLIWSVIIGLPACIAFPQIRIARISSRHRREFDTLCREYEDKAQTPENAMDFARRLETLRVCQRGERQR